MGPVDRRCALSCLGLLRLLCGVREAHRMAIPDQAGVFGPHVLLYLATAMFYWWPLALVSRPLWYVQAFLFGVSTMLNITSHRRSRQDA